MVNDLIEEIKDLVEIPEIERIIRHRIEELKYMLSESIYLYRDIEESLLELKPPKHPGKMHLCGQIFELTLIGKKTWIPSIPYPLKDFDIYGIIPQEVIDFIVKYKTQIGMPILLPGTTFPGLEERKFDLSFEKINNKLFTGIIYEHGGAKKIVKIETPGGKVDSREKYRKIKELNRYLIKSDDYFLHVTSEFQCRWKQLIDSEVLEELNAK
jgi:hypothetical protein